MSNTSLYDVIKKPVVSEKTTMLGSSNQYVFEVGRSFNKQSVKKSVEKIFSVTVDSVRTFVRKGKEKKFKGIKGKRADVKYAIVSLKKGDEIDISGGVK
ncbi:MAG: 50S ribosomal protein L23 [Rickettsiales bacterium]